LFWRQEQEEECWKGNERKSEWPNQKVCNLNLLFYKVPTGFDHQALTAYGDNNIRLLIPIGNCAVRLHNVVVTMITKF